VRVRVPRLVTWVRFVTGLLTIVIIWCPVDDVVLSFSGPACVTSHVGLQAAVSTTTRYAPRRIPSGGALVPLAPQPGETVWDHRGIFDPDVVMVKVTSRDVSVNYPALACSVLMSLTALVWMFGDRVARNNRIERA
jgi:hypothetical protein